VGAKLSKKACLLWISELFETTIGIYSGGFVAVSLYGMVCVH
jgi:hypothetical protein